MGKKSAPIFNMRLIQFVTLCFAWLWHCCTALPLSLSRTCCEVVTCNDDFENIMIAGHKNNNNFSETTQIYCHSKIEIPILLPSACGSNPMCVRNKITEEEFKKNTYKCAPIEHLQTIDSNAEPFQARPYTFYSFQLRYIYEYIFIGGGCLRLRADRAMVLNFAAFNCCYSCSASTRPHRAMRMSEKWIHSHLMFTIQFDWDSL